jgi:hypothetical protein
VRHVFARRLQLWMGTHPSCPSKLLSSGEDLKAYVKAHPELLGDKVVEKFGDDLPFLFKVRLASGKRVSLLPKLMGRQTWLDRSLRSARPSLSRRTRTRSLLRNCTRKGRMSTRVSVQSVVRISSSRLN